MVIYTVTEVVGKWRVTRYDQSSNVATPIYRELDDENQAITQAIIRAEDDRPSKIMRISKEGNAEILVEFDRLEPEFKD